MSIREIKQLVDIFCQRVLTNKTTYILLDYRNNVLKYFLNNTSTIQTPTTNNVQQQHFDGNSHKPPPQHTTATQQLTTVESVEMDIGEIKQLVEIFCWRVLSNKSTFISVEYRNNELKYFAQLYRLDDHPQQPLPPHRTGNSITHISGYDSINA